MAIDINVPSQVRPYANLAAFPATGAVKTIYIAEDTNKTYRWTGSAYVEISVADLVGYVPYTGATGNVNLGAYDAYVSKLWLYDNPVGGYGSVHLTDSVFHVEDVDGHSMVTFEDGAFTIANGASVRALLNIAGLTANRDYVLPNVSGILALTSDIPSLAGYVPTSRTLTINGTTQDLSADRTFNISTGITIGTTAITSGTVGRVLFEGAGNVVQESANLFWDNVNGRLGIGTSSPLVKLVTVGANVINPINANGGNHTMQIIDTTAMAIGIGGAIGLGGVFDAIGTQTIFAQISGIKENATNSNFSSALTLSTRVTGANILERMRIASTGNVLINTTTDAGFKLDVNGTARVQTSLVINGSSSLFSSLISAYQNGNNRILTLGLSTSKTDSTTRTFCSLSSSETSTPQSLDFQFVGATFINDRYHLFQTSETGVNYGGGMVLQRDGGWVGIGSGQQFSSAILAVTSTTKGFLPPRMTTTQKNAIATPAEGLQVWDTTLKLMFVYNGTTWISL